MFRTSFDNLGKLCRRTPSSIEEDSTNSGRTDIGSSWVREETVGEGHYVGFGWSSPFELPRWAKFNKPHPLSKRLLQGFAERYDVLLRSTDGFCTLEVLSLGDRQEESPADFAPEMGSCEHELSFELAGVAKLEEVSIEDRLNFFEELILFAFFDTKDKLVEVVGDPQYIDDSTEL